MTACIYHLSRLCRRGIAGVYVTGQVHASILIKIEVEASARC